MDMSAATPSGYLAHLTPVQLEHFERIKRIVLGVAPDATLGMGYGMPAFKYKGKPLLYFGAFKDHMSIFPTSGPIEALHAQLAHYATGKGTVQFTAEKPLPEELIVALLQARIAQI